MCANHNRKGNIQLSTSLKLTNGIQWKCIWNGANPFRTGVALTILSHLRWEWTHDDERTRVRKNAANINTYHRKLCDFFFHFYSFSFFSKTIKNVQFFPSNIILFHSHFETFHLPWIDASNDCIETFYREFTLQCVNGVARLWGLLKRTFLSVSIRDYTHTNLFKKSVKCKRFPSLFLSISFRYEHTVCSHSLSIEQWIL